jgi:hypothetical protein
MKIAAPPARTPLSHTPPAQPQRHHRAGATTAQPGSQASVIADCTGRRQNEPHQTYHQSSPPQTTTDTAKTPQRGEPATAMGMGFQI